MSGSKLVFTIFLIIILSLGGLLGFYFYLNRTSTLNQNPVAGTKPTFTGFDQISLDNSQGGNGSKTDLGSYTAPTSTPITVATTTVVRENEELLRIISPKPVAGFDFIVRDINVSTSSTPTGTSTKEIKLALKNKKIIPQEFIRYILKANGNVFETGTSSTSTTDRLTNQTIPKLQEAFFNAKGDGVLVRNIIGDDGIQTRYLSLKQNQDQSTSTIQTVTTVNLPLNITEVSISPDKTKMFYTRNSGTRGTISNLDGGATLGVFESPYREWLPQWMSSGTILLNTKPSVLSAGYVYSFDVKTSTTKKVLGGLVGMTSLGSKDGQNLLYAETGNNSLGLLLHNFKEGSERFLPARTLPEKCVWGNKYSKVIYCAVPNAVSKNNAYPDDWYLGLVHFNDTIWRMDLETGENKLIVNPEQQTTIPFDIVDMKVSKNDDYLIFKEKNTLSLWGIKLKTPVVATTTTAR
jgi:hypothetical protein